MIRGFQTFFVVLALAFCQAALASDMLTGEQIKQTLSGKKFQWGKSNRATTVKYLPDGRIEGSKIGRGGALPDQGKWWVNGDQYCRQWNNWFDGNKKCYTMKREGKKYRLIRPDGTPLSAVGWEIR